MKSNVFDYSYDEKLKANEFLNTHDYCLPFVGVNYKDAKVKVLHIGNCPYIQASQDINNEFGCDFFIKNWFDNPKLLNLMPKTWTNYCMNTRAVLEEFLTTHKNEFNLSKKMNYNIFGFITKMLSDSIVAEKNIGCRTKIDSISMPKDNSANCKNQKTKDERKKVYLEKLETYKEKTKIYNYVAFTDFHMFPSLINGNANVLDSLIKSNTNNQNNVHTFYEKVKEQSWETLKHIIDVLKPDIILITSKPVSNIFPSSTYDDRVIKMKHPNSLFNKDAKIEYFEDFNTQVELMIHK